MKSSSLVVCKEGEILKRNGRLSEKPRSRTTHDSVPPDKSSYQIISTRLESVIAVSLVISGRSFILAAATIASSKISPLILMPIASVISSRSSGSRSNPCLMVRAAAHRSKDVESFIWPIL